MNMIDRGFKRYQWLLVALALAALTLVVYAPAFHADFVDYDDPLYVTENPWVLEGLNSETFGKAWTERVAGNWHPITMLSHLLDVSMNDLNPSGHHLTSMVIHAINVALLFMLFHNLFGGLFRPALAATLFALHPFNVDSVVWIAERKNVLSTLFWLTGTALYVRFVRRPSILAMVGTILMYTLGLMSKPMLVTFPFTLLMLDLWPLRRVRGISPDDWPVWVRLIQEKSTLFLLTIVFSTYTLMTQFPVGYKHSLIEQPMWARLLFSLEHYRMYLEKFFWPSGLSVLYPQLHMPPDVISVVFSGLLLLGITVTVLVLIRRSPALAFGWFWFAGTIFPVVGIIGIGQHSIADRYMYVPIIGLVTALVWGVPTIQRKAVKRVAIGSGIMAIIICGWITRNMISHWQTSEALFQRAVNVTDRNFVMLSNLGNELTKQGRMEEAKVLLHEAIQIEPRHAPALNNLGVILSAEGHHQEAVKQLEAALEYQPELKITRINLARSYLQLERYQDAYRQYQILYRIEPEDPDVRDGLILTKQKLGLPAGFMQ